MHQLGVTSFDNSSPQLSKLMKQRRSKPSFLYGQKVVQSILVNHQQPRCIMPSKRHQSVISNQTGTATHSLKTTKTLNISMRVSSSEPSVVKRASKEHFKSKMKGIDKLPK